MSQEAAREGAPTLLLVDDDEVLRERLARALRERGFDVATASAGEEAIAVARRDAPEFAVVDLRMPGANGIEVLEALREVDPATRVLILTGYGSIATAVDATRRGAVGYLSKPADADEVVAALTGRPVAEGMAEIETPSLARAEWEHIQRVLADCAGNVSETARRLGLHRRSLQRKLQKHPPAR
ncbi:MAG: response regulator [Deltaproteobacteria bacterium]